MEILRQIATVPVDLNERPRIPITITACGVEANEDDQAKKTKLSAVEMFEQNIE